MNLNDLENPSRKPDPITCPICHRTYTFEWEDEIWWPTGAAWWSTDAYEFLCRRTCWILSIAATE